VDSLVVEQGRDRAAGVRIRSVCVFCGPARGLDPRFVDAARATGALLAGRSLASVLQTQVGHRLEWHHVVI